MLCGAICSICNVFGQTVPHVKNTIKVNNDGRQGKVLQLKKTNNKNSNYWRDIKV